ncbi:MAG TPA: ribbon-helix-helix domain-containing protein [Candidatus Nanoarchaeia archaeon]|nr:ribbon-helix-helix domain-containing protein [Candidatus Nanoarchaeia archaeon]
MKERITITVDKELLRWLDEKVNSKVFANRSHGFEFLVKSKITAERSIMSYNSAKSESER